VVGAVVVPEVSKPHKYREMAEAWKRYLNTREGHRPSPVMPADFIRLFEQVRAVEQERDEIARDYEKVHAERLAMERDAARLELEKHGLIEQLEAYRTAFVKLDHAIGDLDDFAENVSHGLKASSPAGVPDSVVAYFEELERREAQGYAREGHPFQLIVPRDSNPASEPPCADSSLLNWGSHLLRGGQNQDSERDK
jgi:CHAD domain-containing protein